MDIVVLVLRDLLPLPYDEQQLSTICSSSYSQDIATRLLACVPACMLNVEEVKWMRSLQSPYFRCTLPTLSTFIFVKDLILLTPLQINAQIGSGGTLLYFYPLMLLFRYDGKTPNPSAFQPDSCEKPNISVFPLLN